MAWVCRSELRTVLIQRTEDSEGPRVDRINCARSTFDQSEGSDCLLLPDRPLD